ncbi:uncharacterized protein LOC106069763 [Biomphalaria glabrata]|uniref:Uncharacterized protein LOC106069763 n=1 Tax=Biomphalaria glabrata TaxID=6526 RepID=A0A9W3AAZ3_BIOGL|nr:uncharacterized protein LOC106069763 [Biomphalaria glabrata]XP_055884317.1 uncharacterized protein LOC106069763 [Biomphalaria glabrata]XP_055884318.1 uncharacterized protein LOC106069763 [Biomphalaria glabrata]XP_055884320.1 uncharacterized protein LOC106069763 [Biomphalaria glabrata]XP_055884321.1 uncharacterized protein LOC106069763 [Biomphalaria glabrata]KAI8773735.1 CAunnamed protein product [Biomphalaria glabrata]
MRQGRQSRDISELEEMARNTYKKSKYSLTMDSGNNSIPLKSLPSRGVSTSEPDECEHPVISGTGAVATCFFLIGFLMFLVAFASNDWLGLEKGITLSLWRKCTRDFALNVWHCQPWQNAPDFIRAVQGFCIVGLITYILSVMILIAYLTIQYLQRLRGVLIALCLLLFTSGCMTLMALVVMGIKGHDYFKLLRADGGELAHLSSKGVDTSGVFYVGWSFVVAVISAFITLASFLFCMIEFVHINEDVD